MKSEGRVHDEGEENEADKKLADSLHVFCCSATEYQRIQNPLPDDKPPKVTIQMGLVARKPVFRVSAKVRFKPASSATGTS